MFKLEFSTDNAAFEDNGQETRAHEVQLILLRISAKLAHGDTFGAVKDSNGNTIGRWSLSEDKP